MITQNIEELFIGQGVKYRIPIYQRRYVWENNNWRHLWDDIKETANLRTKLKKDGAEEDIKGKEHFTGVIVIRAENETREIVDGQQRLTTFQIILCAIRDVCRELDYNDIVEYIEDQLIGHSRGDLPFEEYCKLLPTAQSDREAFMPLVNGNASESSGRIHDAYVYFKNEIKNYVGTDYDKMLNLYTVFLENIQVVTMPLDTRRKAAKIFEALNGRGRALSQFDHLRNNVFLKAGEARHDLYQRYWQHFNSKPYWLSDEEVVDSFLVNFLKAKLGPKFDYKLPYFDLYQRNYRSALRVNLNLHEDDSEFIKYEFKELERYSCAYEEISNCHQNDPLWFYKFLADKFGITSWHPLVLLLKSEKDKLRISDEDLSLTFRILESYLVRCMLCHRPASIRYENYEKLSVEKDPIIGKEGLISLVRNQESFNPATIAAHLANLTGDQKWQNDQEIKRLLHNADSRDTDICRYVLFGIEKELASNYLDVPSPTFEDWLNREHIMPRGWEQKHLELSKRNWPLSDNEYDAKAREREEWVKSIGNLTLLHKGLNNKIGNRSFDFKKRLYDKYSGLLLTKDIVTKLNKVDQRVERVNWDVPDIRKRELVLCELFYKIWPSAESFRKNFAGK